MANTINTEEQLQATCYQWFSATYPALRGTLFAVPNGGRRVGLDGNTLKATGVISGVSDMILVCYQEVFFIEFKFGNGSQSDNQVRFQKIVENLGHRYKIFYSLWTFQDFIKQVV